MLSIRSIAVVGALALVAGAVIGEAANCKIYYPPYVVDQGATLYVASEADGMYVNMFASKHANGADSLDIAYLGLRPGFSVPVHRHLDADEYMYVLSGQGGYAYWGSEYPAPTEVAIGSGTVAFIQRNLLHTFWNNGTEDLIMHLTSKSIARSEYLAGWPESPSGGVGYIPATGDNIWEKACPPGHEPDPEETWEDVPLEDKDEAAGEASPDREL